MTPLKARPAAHVVDYIADYMKAAKRCSRCIRHVVGFQADYMPRIPANTRFLLSKCSRCSRLSKLRMGKENRLESPETRGAVTPHPKQMRTDYIDYIFRPQTVRFTMTAQPELNLNIPAPKPARRLPIEHPDGGQFPAWIQEQLKTNKKKPAPRHRTEHHHCRHCLQIVVTGTYDLAAKTGRAFLTVTIDPTPLDPQQELACLLTDRRTYRAQAHPASISIISSRTARWEYTWHPGELVLPAHHCGARFPGFHTPPATPTERTTSDDPDGLTF